MPEYSTLAAVDLGSNSFACQIARVVDDLLYPLDSLREPIRLAAGLNKDKILDEATQERALACLRRFGERLRGFDHRAVRAVGTNTFRVAKNAPDFIRKASAALGFPIEVIAGREEARLIYLGVVHSVPASKAKRLVIDIGGGSTELIIGAGYKPQVLESLFMGCVSHSMRYFENGRMTKSAFRDAELAAADELQPITGSFSRGHWDEAIGSSGSLRSIALLLELNGLDTGDITPGGLDRLRALLIKDGDLSTLKLQGLRPDRLAVLPGGLAIIRAIMNELKIDRVIVADGAIREGVLYDLVGRFRRHDMRDVTVAQFMQRYHVEALQARRVGLLARNLCAQFKWGSDELAETQDRYVAWAAKLHEIGISVAYSGYHKHSAYIIANGDMPGFSRDEQALMAALVLGHRRSLKKSRPSIEDHADLRLVFALRLAAMFYRRRAAINVPPMQVRADGRTFSLDIEGDWLARNPLTVAALRGEIRDWERIGVNLRVAKLDAMEPELSASAA
jgi:exopolyphosphatase/guanosine-5'-triphosphate,3'-diphosphate pyrophosphatase